MSILENNIIFAKTIKITYSADYMVAKFEGNTHSIEEDVPKERKIEKEVILTIVGLNFEKGSRWQFMYDGFKISMIVKNDALKKKINEGQRFGRGDAIRVKLRIVQSYNKEYKAYVNKSYKIIDFFELIPQEKLDLFERIKALKSLENIESKPTYDEEYIKRKIEEATPIWKGVDADEYVRSIRDGTF